MLTALVTRSIANRRSVLLAVPFLLVALFLVGGSVMNLMTSESDAPGAESVRASKALNAAAGMSTNLDVIAIVSPKEGIATESGKLRVSDVALVLYNTPGVAKVQSPYLDNNKALISIDGRSALVTAQFENGITRDTVAKSIEAAFANQPDVKLGGAAVTGLEIGDRVKDELGKAELIALPILFLLALWIFRGVIAAGITIGIGVLSIVTTLSVLRLFIEFTTISSFVLNLVTGLGLGLAIDYCLFIISRYREEAVRYGYTPKAALVAGVAAGRTVMFSALTVAASLSSLMIFPQTFLRSMGIGGATVTLAASLVTITVLPALLALLGRWIDALSLPGAARARAKDAGDVHQVGWYKLAGWVMRHALPVLIACIALVGVISWPAMHTKFSNIDVHSLPVTSSARAANDRVASQFPGGGGTTLTLAVTAGPNDNAKVAALAQKVATVANVKVTAPAQFLSNNTWSLGAVILAPPFSDTARSAVEGVRAISGSVPFLVAGDAAAFKDNETLIVANLPMTAVLVGLAVLIVIFLLTGSVVLSVKTLLLNLLNVMMTLGVLVWVFQEGHFQGLLHYTSTGYIDLAMPVLVAVFGFGLSTDYGVFLLSRIKESWDVTGDNREAVATGVGRSGRIISSAALLLCVAVGAFSTSSVLFIKQLGLGTAVSVLLDATIIRAFLVPSAMKLMASANWWAPAPLRRLHERWGIEEGGAAVVDDGVPDGVLAADPMAAFSAAWTSTVLTAPAPPVPHVAAHRAPERPELRLVPPPVDEPAPVLRLVPSSYEAGEITREPTPPREVTGRHAAVPAARNQAGRHRR